MAFAAGQQGFDPFPLIISKGVTTGHVFTELSTAHTHRPFLQLVTGPSSRFPTKDLCTNMARHPERSEGSVVAPSRSLAALGMTVPNTACSLFPVSGPLRWEKNLFLCPATALR